MGGPVRCPSQEPGSNIHFEWKAEALVERISGGYYNNGDSEVTRDAAIVLDRAGNYTVTASLLDWSDSVTKKFTVVDGSASGGGGAPPGNIMQIHRMNLTSVTAYTAAHEAIGEVVPGMEFARGEPVFVQSVFSNPHKAPVSQFILSSIVRDESRPSARPVCKCDWRRRRAAWQDGRAGAAVGSRAGRQLYNHDIFVDRCRPQKHDACQSRSGNTCQGGSSREGTAAIGGCSRACPAIALCSGRPDLFCAWPSACCSRQACALCSRRWGSALSCPDLLCFP